MTVGRTWAGTPLADRRAARGEALLDAGVTALGSPDAKPLTVRAVCRCAGLTERYFYESFDDRDAFVRAAYDHVAARAEHRLAETAGATRTDGVDARRAVEAFVDLMLDDPVVGRALLLAPAYEPALSSRGTARALGFVALVRSRMPASADAELVAIGIVGALTGLLMAYLSGAVDVDRVDLTRACLDVVMSLGASS